MVMNAYALFDKVDDVKFDNSVIPEWQSDESIKQLFYYVDGEDVYFVIQRDNDDYHVTAHAQLTEDGLQPIQVTGYGVPGGAVQQYGDNNWLSDQEVITKADIWEKGNERLQQFKDEGNEATSDENTYIEFVKTFSTSEDGGIESLDDELTDEELVFAAQIENQDIATDNLKEVLRYGAVIEPIDDGYKVTGMQYPYEDDYYISSDEIKSELNNDTDETYANGETTSTH
ncbi:MAG: hypothetical protein MR008_05745, partial [Aerococcus sp.]|nr:hypothetical protein [Aerococcus sp.]